jgi:two-component system, NtrC family, sensor kinase
MKIIHKTVLSNVFNLALIMLVGFFAFQNLNLVLTKLRFVEISDDLNSSFLEMRLSEKNYFLYKDPSAIDAIKEKIDYATGTIANSEQDIIRAVGEKNLEELKVHLSSYSEALKKLQHGKPWDKRLEAGLRTQGQQLKEFSETMRRLERERVNEIISSSKRILLYSLCAIFLLAIVVSHLASNRLLASLRKIEKAAVTITGGRFSKIKGIRSKDELGSVVNAFNTMSEELASREEEIIQAKKLASIGTLTAGVAHELTNPLNNISMIAQTYEDLYAKLTDEQRLDFMAKVDEEADRIKTIVKNLLDFSKPKAADLKPTDVNAVVRKTLSLVQNMLDISNIDTRLALGEGLPLAMIDDHQIEQVLVNLIINAIHAMSSGGILNIETRGFADTGFVEVVIRDDGKGIPPEYLPHIFDPFFSTKGVRGTGLGLSVSYGIIKNHHGNIRVDSRVGVGTEFTVELPSYKGEESNHGQLQDNGN